MRSIKKIITRIIPSPLLRAYHFLVPHIGACIYRYPSRRLIVLAVTGTKGKSSTTEMLNAILEAAGHKTALLNSIRIKVADESEPNLMRMSMPGRFFIQHFLRQAVDAGCTVAIIEMTSEGARQYRHRAIDLDGLIFTNLTPEHIESHGSLEAYANAKYEIGKQLARSRKRPRIIVANEEDAQGKRYLSLPVDRIIPFNLSSTEHTSDAHGGQFRFKDMHLRTHLPGEFSLRNALAAALLTDAIGVQTADIATGLDRLHSIPGRAERIEEGQDFTVVVDYAHTPDSLTALYDAYDSDRKICVLGSTGGGRDTWKRPVMGSIADARCDHVILTNEDPYDEDPRMIIESMAHGMKRAPQIIMDRREAIATALRLAEEKVRLAQGTNEHWAVLISGKGTDPCICGPDGSKTPWSDAGVAREELHKLLAAKNRQV
ncbi:UDP-N-acetylmuramyl-tripeptide synthetase [Candidatus Kaiserbacteria bacterium]|nr:UDP-N-acetylmuramyl-tripeptide synthetase [Candidatus Kaiserbacteria bacterium]